jgi:hypothetical protein
MTVPYRQYTRCVEAQDFVDFSRAVRIAAAGITSGAIAAALAAAAAEPWCLLIAAEIGLLVSVIAYCRIWLYDRLICLGGDVEVIGVVASISPPNTALWDFDWDNDYSINLLMENCAYHCTRAQAAGSLPYGNLVRQQPGIASIGRHTPGHAAFTDPDGTPHTFGLHCEFEGEGNQTLLDAAEAALAFAVGALIACLLLPWPLALMLGVAALLLMILAAIIGNYVRGGSPEDVEPGVGELHPIQTDAEGNVVPGASMVYVAGTWVYDSLHEGWNEIHPIKAFTLVGGPEGWPGDWGGPPVVIERVNEALDDAASDQTRDHQRKREHQWEIHPSVDGCSSVIIT